MRVHGYITHSEQCCVIGTVLVNSFVGFVMISRTFLLVLIFLFIELPANELGDWYIDNCIALESKLHLM